MLFPTKPHTFSKHFPTYKLLVTTACKTLISFTPSSNLIAG